MTAKNRVRGPSPTRKKADSTTPAVVPGVRLTLTISPDDMRNLQVVSDHNLRSMSAQALYYIRACLAKELADIKSAE